MASAQTNLNYIDFHDFGGDVVNANGSTGLDGQNPMGGVSFDASGNAYGMTYEGGPNSNGMVWEITSKGSYKDLHDFGGTITNSNGASGPDGWGPYATVAFDAAGNMYGTTFGGGANAGGIVWEITTSGAFKDLHDFGGTVTNSNGTSGPDGTSPECTVAIDGASNLYGSAANGGANGGSNGMAWKISSTGTYSDLHDFGGTIQFGDGTSGSDGWQIRSGLALDGSGDLFGTAYSGGENSSGILWEITSTGTYKDLHNFGGTVTNANGTSGLDGQFPYTSVTLDKSGDMFGSTYGGGPNNNSGMVWVLGPDGIYKDLHDFGGTVTNSNGSSGPDGMNSRGGVSLDSSGDIYGTTVYGGLNAAGVLWEIVAGGSYKDLHDFGGTVITTNGGIGNDGSNPFGQVTVDPSGNLYGTSETGGQNVDPGMVWGLYHPERVTGLTLSPTTIGGLGTSTGTVKLAGAAPLGGWTVKTHAGASGYLNMPATLTVPFGASSATFAITGTAQRSATVNMGVFASDATSSAEAILTIQGDSISSLTLNPSQIKWTGGGSTGTITINTAAPPGGWTVNLTAGASGYVNMPTSVTVPAGSTSTTFSITTTGLKFFTINLGITANDEASKTTSTLVIAGDAIKSLALSPSTMGWNDTSTATLTLVAAAPPGGWPVSVHAGASGYVNLPSTVTVPAGATSTTFTITGVSQRSGTVAMGIYSNDGPSEGNATLTLIGDSIKSLTLSPTSIGWSGTSTATVTLSAAAPLGGWAITMHAGASGYVSMPSTLTVPAGSTSATFAITGTSQRNSTQTLGIFASDGNVTQEAVLTLTGDSMKSLTLNPTSVAPGGGSTGTVTLNSAAPVGGWVVKLSVGAPAYVGVPTSVTVPAGATSATFAITTKTTDPATGVGVIANDGVSSLEAILTIT